MRVWLASLVGLAGAISISDIFSLAKRESQLCSSPDGLPYLYSGFRAYQVLLVDWPVRHYWYVVRCSQGAVTEQQFFPTNKTSNFIFGEPLYLSKDDCYIISRRRKYAKRISPMFRPFATVGAIYKCSNDLNEPPTAVAAIKSDNLASTITLTTSFHTKMRFTPILFAPGGFKAATKVSSLDISPFENYTYTTEDSHQPWWRVNELVNALLSTHYASDKFAIWEFDALQRHLGEEMGWRDKLNQAITIPDTSNDP